MKYGDHIIFYETPDGEPIEDDLDVFDPKKGYKPTDGVFLEFFQNTVLLPMEHGFTQYIELSALVIDMEARCLKYVDPRHILLDYHILENLKPKKQ